MQNNHIVFIVEQCDVSLRLDKFLASRIKNISRAALQKYITEGLVYLNDKCIRSNSEKLQKGDRVQIANLVYTFKQEQCLKSQYLAINVIYDDDYLAVIDKDHGVTMHPGAGTAENTLAHGLLWMYHGNLSHINSVRPGIVHRLDKDTSGLVLIAKDDNTHGLLTKAIQEKRVERSYMALVQGKIEPRYGVIRTRIARCPYTRIKRSVCQNNDGKIAVTHFQVLKYYKHFSLVECRLETGRTHQIRVHMSYRGHPILGDVLYGGLSKINKSGSVNNVFKINRQALHSSSLKFHHPITGERCEFKSELPKDIQSIFTILDCSIS